MVFTASLLEIQLFNIKQLNLLKGRCGKKAGKFMCCIFGQDS